MNTRVPLNKTVLLAALAAALGLSACAPLLVGGAAVGGALVITDRRTSGAQVDDQAIELKAASRVKELVGDRGNVSITSYNRMVLLTGEVQIATDRQNVEQAVRRIDNVRSIVNELAISGPSSLAARSSDAFVTSKVKATFVDAPNLNANVVKVVTERGVVYLMGRLTEAEGQRATELARSVGGVQKVVQVFETLTPAEIAELRRR